MKRSADGASCSGRQRMYTLTQATQNVCDSDDELNTNNDSDYDEEDVVSDSDDMVDNSDSSSDSDTSDSDNNTNTPGNQGNAQAQQPPAAAAAAAATRGRPRGGTRRPRPPPNKFETGWSGIYNPDEHSDFHFNPRPRPKGKDCEPGPKNIPNSIDADSVPLDFLNLFLDDDFWNTLTNMTNTRAKQVKEDKPDYYYAKIFTTDATVEEMKAFIALRLEMEIHGVMKPRFEDYWRGDNFITDTPGFRTVMTRDRFLALWTFLHFVDERDPTLDKDDKIYKVRSFMNLLLPRFRHFYAPNQHLSLDEGMIPTKNRLSIKQHIKSKPIKWGIKAYMLTEGETGYLINADIYTGRKDDTVIEEIGIVGTVVSDLVTTAGVDGMNHILVMDRFYNSVTLFDYLVNTLGTHAVGTCMTNRKYFPKEIKVKKKMKPGDYHYMCHSGIVAIIWQDNRSIHFLSTYHDPRDVGLVNRRKKDGSLVEIGRPQLVAEYCAYMGGCDINDQVCRLNRTRRHYRWPRRLFIKIFMWACYNAYIIMDHHNPHKKPNKRTRTFGKFIEQIALSLVGTHRKSTKAAPRGDCPERLLNVTPHEPEVSPEATGNQTCVVCMKKHNKHVKDFPAMSYKDRPFKKVKANTWCKFCKTFLCIKPGSTCWHDWHHKVEYWR